MTGIHQTVLSNFKGSTAPSSGLTVLSATRNTLTQSGTTYSATVPLGTAVTNRRVYTFIMSQTTNNGANFDPSGVTLGGTSPAGSSIISQGPQFSVFNYATGTSALFQCTFTSTLLSAAQVFVVSVSGHSGAAASSTVYTAGMSTSMSGGNTTALAVTVDGFIFAGVELELAKTMTWSSSLGNTMVGIDSTSSNIAHCAYSIVTTGGSDVVSWSGGNPSCAGGKYVTFYSK